MSFTQSPFSSPRAPRTRPQPRDRVPVFAVGQRAFVGGEKELVGLLNAGGKEVPGHLASGVEVEILAWRPSRGATLYYVRSTEQRLEGWLGVGSLRTNLGVPSPADPIRPETPLIWISPSAPPSQTTGTMTKHRKAAGTR